MNKNLMIYVTVLVACLLLGGCEVQQKQERRSVIIALDYRASYTIVENEDGHEIYLNGIRGNVGDTITYKW